MAKNNPLGSSLKRSREERGLTQEKLAELANLSTRSVRRLESTGEGTIHSLQCYLGALGLSLPGLLLQRTESLD